MTDPHQAYAKAQQEIQKTDAVEEQQLTAEMQKDLMQSILHGINPMQWLRNLYDFAQRGSRLNQYILSKYNVGITHSSQIVLEPRNRVPVASITQPAFMPAQERPASPIPSPAAPAITEPSITVSEPPPASAQPVALTEQGADAEEETDQSVLQTEPTSFNDGPSETFLKALTNARADVDVAIQESGKLQNGSPKAWRASIEAVVDRLHVVQKLLGTLPQPLSADMNQVANEVASDLSVWQANLNKFQQGIEKDQKEDVEKQVSTAYNETLQSLQNRIGGNKKNVEYTIQQMNKFTFTQATIARISGVWRGFQKTLKADQALGERYQELLSQLNKANAIGAPLQRLAAINAVRSQLSLVRVDYRDANADLARGSDRLMPYDFLTPVPDRPNFQEGEEVYVAISAQQVEKGWRVVAVDGDTLTLSKNGETIDRPKNQVWHLGEIEGGRAFNSNVPRHVMAEMINRRYTLLARYARITPEQYHELFDGTIQQGSVGNCYLIAGFQALRTSPHAEVILRTSIRIEGDGFVVKIPLGNADGTEVQVSRKEMGNVITSSGRILTPVRANEGWVALEAAFTKHRFGNVDGGGVNRQASAGGIPGRAMRFVLGGAVNYESHYSGAPFRSISGGVWSRISSVEATLNAFPNGQTLLTCGTLRLVGNSGGDRELYQIDGISFHQMHAYAVTHVNPESRTVTVVNPHNTSAPIQLTYNQFMRAFCLVDVNRVNYNTIFHTA